MKKTQETTEVNQEFSRNWLLCIGAHVTLENYVSDVFSNKSIKILMTMIIIISMVLQSQTSFLLCLIYFSVSILNAEE